MLRQFSLTRAALGTLLAVGLMAGSAGAAMAQDDEVVAGDVHPAHIHVGTCEDFEPNPLAPLNDLTPIQNDDEEDNAPQGTLTASGVFFSDSDEIEFQFYEDILATAHVIVVHESHENIEHYIACGDIGGVVVDDEVTIGIHPLNDSGYSGIAMLNADGGGEVDVRVYLSEPQTVSPNGVDDAADEDPDADDDHDEDPDATPED